MEQQVIKGTKEYNKNILLLGFLVGVFISFIYAIVMFFYITPDSNQSLFFQLGWIFLWFLFFGLFWGTTCSSLGYLFSNGRNKFSRWILTILLCLILIFYIFGEITLPGNYGNSFYNDYTIGSLGFIFSIWFMIDDYTIGSLSLIFSIWFMIVFLENSLRNKKELSSWKGLFATALIVPLFFGLFSIVGFSLAYFIVAPLFILIYIILGIVYIVRIRKIKIKNV